MNTCEEMRAIAIKKRIEIMREIEEKWLPGVLGLIRGYANQGHSEITLNVYSLNEDARLTLVPYAGKQEAMMLASLLGKHGFSAGATDEGTLRVIWMGDNA